MLAEVNVYHSIIIETETFTEGVLCDFETPVEIAFQRCCEIEIEEEGEVALTEGMKQFIMYLSLPFECAQDIAYLVLETACNNCTDTVSIDGGVLLVDAWGEWKCEV